MVKKKDQGWSPNAPAGASGDHLLRKCPNSTSSKVELSVILRPLSQFFLMRAID